MVIATWYHDKTHDTFNGTSILLQKHENKSQPRVYYYKVPKTYIF